MKELIRFTKRMMIVIGILCTLFVVIVIIGVANSPTPATQRSPPVAEISPSPHKPVLVATPIPTVKAMSKPTSTPSTEAIGNYIVNQDANLRNGPGITFSIVGSAKRGDEVEVASRNDAGDWYQLSGGEWIAAFLVQDDAIVLPEDEVTEQDITSYVNDIVGVAAIYDSAFSELRALFRMVSDNPSIILIDSWKGSVLVQLALVQMAGKDVREIVPPVHLQPIHEQLLLGASHYDNATNLVAGWLDNFDSQGLEQGVLEMNAGDSALSKAIMLIEALNVNTTYTMYVA